MSTTTDYHCLTVKEPEKQPIAVSEYDFTHEDWDWLEQQMIEKAEILQWLADH